jgi:outer membrane biosynthesis protein TonB
LGEKSEDSPTQLDDTAEGAPDTSAVGSDPDTSLTTTLSNEYLDATIAAESNSFQKCQATALRDGKAAKGTLIVGITIAPTGRVSQARIIDSNIKNLSLQKCVRSVFLRIPFQSFKGEPIAASYPIVFE